MAHNNQLCVWDLTLSCRVCDDYAVVKEALQAIAKKWCFQKERGTGADPGEYDSDSDESNLSDSESDSGDERGTYVYCGGDIDDCSDYSSSDYSSEEESEEHYSCDSDSDSSEIDNSQGYEHFQIHLSLIKKRRRSDILKICKANQVTQILAKAYWCPSSNNGLCKAEFYAMKLDTRIEGPWSDMDEETIPMPRHLQHITEWKPWQQTLLDLLNYNRSSRTVYVLLDKKGGLGKSSLVIKTVVERFMNAKSIPAYCSPNIFLDTMAACMAQIRDDTELLWIDMPRAMAKSKQNGFWAAVENVKSGVCFDPRYQFKQKYFSSPAVCVMTNTIPSDLKKMLSADRWCFLQVIDNELVLYPSGNKLDINYPVEESEEEAPSGEEAPCEEDPEVFASMPSMPAHNDECQIGNIVDTSI